MPDRPPKAAEPMISIAPDIPGTLWAMVCMPVVISTAPKRAGRKREGMAKGNTVRYRASMEKSMMYPPIFIMVSKQPIMCPSKEKGYSVKVVLSVNGCGRFL